MADDGLTDGGWEALDGLEGLEELFQAGPPVASGPVAIALLDGAEVEGPFLHRGPHGFPLVEVWEGELRSTGASQGRRVGLVGMLPHSAGPHDLLESYGAGVWVCVVRGSSGRILGSRWVTTGTTAQRQARAARQARPATPPEEDGPGGPPAWVAQLLARQEEAAAELQRRQLEDAAQVRAELAEMRQAEARRRQVEFEEMKAELARARQGGGRPSSPGEHVAALREWLDEGESMRAQLARLAPAPTPDVPEPDAPQKSFMEEVAGELGGFLKNAGDLKDLLSMVKG